MKLRKILAGFLAGAVAMSSMVVTSLTAMADTTTAPLYKCLSSYSVDTISDVSMIAGATTVTINMTYTACNEHSNGKAYFNTNAGWKEATYGTDGQSFVLTEGVATDVTITGAEVTDWFQVGVNEYGGGTLTLNKITFSNDTGDLATITPDFTINEKFSSTGLVSDWSAANGATKAVFNMEYTAANEYANGKIFVNTDGGYKELSFGTADTYGDAQLTVGTAKDITIEGVDISNWGDFGVNEYGGGSLILYSVKFIDDTGKVYLEIPAPAPTTYALTLPTSTTGGKVTSDVTDATAVEEGTDVTITVTPDTGYEVDKVTVGGKEVALTNGKYTFEMTADTAVTATFKAIEVTAVALDKTALDLDIGGVYTFTTTITPDDALDQTLTWTSSDTAVATVVNGKVTAVAAGTATITATAASGVKATCTVTVSEEEAAVVNVTGVTLDKTTAELEIGGTVTLKATVAPVDATDDSVTWKSSDAAVATVDANGVVKAVAVGTATITVTTTDGAKTATCTVTVKETAKDTGYDKAEADFAPEKIVSQTATTADGKTHKRFVIKVSEESVKDKNTVIFTLSNGTETKQVESKNSYAALSASGVTVTVEDGYVFLVLTVNNIPEGITVTCTGYEVVNK